jgi:hydrogenase nickel incorporation protein HypA/HybF
MHELSIAQSLVDSVRAHASSRGGAAVMRIGVQVGELSGVDPESLRFSFDILIRGTDLEQATLDIEQVALRQRCEQCAQEFPVVEFTLVCPACGVATQLVSGNELQLTHLELEA